MSNSMAWWVLNFQNTFKMMGLQLMIVETYGGWIGPGGPTAWPPQSPDLNPQDYYLWGYLNGIIYNSEVNTGEDY